MTDWCEPWKQRRFCGSVDSWDARNSDDRDPFHRDRARIIHSAAFRRLQAKTQVLGIGESDFRRTRLTHSMEVAQIAKGIVSHLKCKNAAMPYDGRVFPELLPSMDLIEAIGLAHDLGHPPFGHSGEVALNYMMRNSGGFEGNAQTLRLLSKHESYRRNYGLDLTRRTLLGILKYPAPYSKVNRLTMPNTPIKDSLLEVGDWKPPKCYFDCDDDVVKWLLEPLSENDRRLFLSLDEEPTAHKKGKSKYSTIDTSILNVADDIAYGTHDLEDGITLGLIRKWDWDNMWNKYDIANKCAKLIHDYTLHEIRKGLFTSSSDGRKRAIGALVHALICSTKITINSNFDGALVKYNVACDQEAKAFIDMLMGLTNEKMIQIQQVQTSEFRGRHLVMHVFEAIASSPKSMLKEGYFRDEYEHATESNKDRVVCDYVAGMTDEYATKIYERLYVPRHGTVFDKL